MVFDRLFREITIEDLGRWVTKITSNSHNWMWQKYDISYYWNTKYCWNIILTENTLFPVCIGKKIISRCIFSDIRAPSIPNYLNISHTIFLQLADTIVPNFWRIYLNSGSVLSLALMKFLMSPNFKWSVGINTVFFYKRKLQQ